MGQSIRQFMWGYQPHFRTSLRFFANAALKHAGIRADAVALLIGIQEPGGESYPVCVEPEDGPWPVTLFDHLEERIQEFVLQDPRQEMVYGDDPSNRDKPIWMRQTAIRKAVIERLDVFDRENQVRSFVGAATLVDGYRVVPVLQIPARDIEAQPTLQIRVRHERRMCTSFLDALLMVILEQAGTEMLIPEPGRAGGTFSRDLDDVLRAGGRRLMFVPESAATRRWSGGLFGGCNQVSALRYEGSEGTGRMVLAARGHDCVQVDLELEHPVPLSKANWARKILQMGSQEVSLLCDGSTIYGLGRLSDAYTTAREDAFLVDFVGHYTWELRHQSTVLMRTAYGVPRLPQSRLSEGELQGLVRRIFPSATTNAECISSLVRVALEQKHGTLIVVSENARDEAKRLASQATPIKPAVLSDSMVRRVTGIDGAVLVDPRGLCHAIGVILDGHATLDGDPSRGARFNSAMKYVRSAEPMTTVAVVVSEDGHVNVLPNLRPQLRRSEIEHHIGELRRLAEDVHEDWHEPQSWLDRHRFYLNQEQCRQVNDLLEELHAKVKEVPNMIWWTTRPFAPDPEMNESYFLDDSPTRT